jgi:hypothetical protein
MHGRADLERVEKSPAVGERWSLSLALHIRSAGLVMRLTAAIALKVL